MDIKDLFSEAKSIQPSHLSKTIGKNRLLERIGASSGSALSSLSTKEQGFERVAPSEHFRQMAWMRLVSRMQRAKHSASHAFVRFCRKLAVYGALTSVVVFGVFSNIVLAPPPIIEAKAETYLLILEGQVEVKSLAGEWVPARNRLGLKSLDTIRTKQGTHAEIHFFDSSVSRLAPNTEVLIKTLKEHPSIAKTGYVNLDLKRGKIWTKALNIKDNDSKIVVETDACTISSHQATFFVASEPSTGTEVVAYDRAVDLELNSNKAVVQEGYRVRLANNQVIQEKVEVVAETAEAEWVAQNKERDQQLEQELVQETIEIASQEAGILPTSTLYNAKLLQEKTQTILSDDSARFASLKESATTRLNEAASLLANNNTDLAHGVLQNFESHIEELLPLIENDPNLQLEIENLLKDKEQHFLAINHLNSLLYPVKEAIHDAREKIVLNESDKQLVRLEIANETLHQVQDLLAEDRDDLAGKEMKKVKDLVNNIADSGELAVSDTLATEVMPVVQEIAAGLENIDDQELVQDLQATENVVKLIANEAAPLEPSIQVAFAVELNDPDVQIEVELPQNSKLEVEVVVENEPEVIDREYVLERFINESSKLQMAKQQQIEHAENRVDIFVEKTEIFNTLRAKESQTRTMLRNIKNNPSELDYLYRLRNQVDIRLRHLVNEKIKAIEATIK